MKKSLPLVLHLDTATRLSMWSCTLEQRGPFQCVVFRKDRSSHEHVFIIDQAADDTWGLYVDDDSAQFLCVVTMHSSTHVTLEDHIVAYSKARALEAALVL